MNEQILIVDDDYSILRMLEIILQKHNYNPKCFENPIEALENLKQNSYDLIISDYFMPQMDGEDFLKKVRQRDSYMPFIVLTTNDDIDNAIKLLKAGADDYIHKPVVMDELIFRIRKTIEEKRNKQIIDQINREKEILILESKRLVDWKELYAAKEIKQTDTVLSLFSRTLNQGGSFIWLDLLKSQLEKIDEDNYKINKRLVDLIIKTTDRYQSFFDNITFLSSLDTLELTKESIPYENFVHNVRDFVEHDLKEVTGESAKRIVTQVSNHKLNVFLNLDMEQIKKIIKELIINAIKYSPEDTDVFILLEKNTENNGEFVDLVVKNTPKDMKAKDDKGQPIFGIPYEYSELVFDLFYTINAYPTDFPGEEWQGGTGLYISRKLLRRMGGWIKTANGVDYSRGEPEPYVKFTVTIPFT